MIRFNQIKMNTEHTREQLVKKVASLLRVQEKEILQLSIVRQSIDARKKPEIFYSYVIDVFLWRCDDYEKDFIKKIRKNVLNTTVFSCFFNKKLKRRMIQYIHYVTLPLYNVYRSNK